MSSSIFTNVSSLNAQRLLSLNTSRLGKSIERVASGNRIVNGSDDVAGLAISDSLRSDVRTLRQAIRNTNDGVSLLNVAEGALAEQSSIIIRLRELASQAATGSIGQNERQTLQLEFNSIRSEFDRIAITTEFGGKVLLNGALSASARSLDQFNIQVGMDSSENSRINLNKEVNLSASTAKGLGIDALSIDTVEGSLQSMGTLESAGNALTQIRGRTGAVQNRLARTLATLSTTVENLVAAESTIRDADIAEEIAILTRNQILTQASVSMLDQTNLFAKNMIQFLEI